MPSSPTENSKHADGGVPAERGKGYEQGNLELLIAAGPGAASLSKPNLVKRA